MAGQTFKAPDGFTITMDAKNHHLYKPVFIGEIQANGQFNVVWKTPGPIRATAVEPVHPGRQGQEGRAREEVARARPRHSGGSGFVITRCRTLCDAAIPLGGKEQR